MIILLDLNFTLVENSDAKLSPFIRQIVGERYRQWLVELIKPYHVILMTARPAKYHVPTLESIKVKTGWQPQEAHFNQYNQRPPEAKQIMLRDHVLPSHGEGPYLAIESNPATSAMYRNYGIGSFKVRPGEVWTSLPI